MEISEEKKGDALVLSLSGRLDAATSKAFQDRILAVIDAGERRLVVDLSQLDYLSSSGLRVFLLAAQRLSGANGKIVLCSLMKPVREVFDIVGFSSLFSIYGSADEALRSL